MKIKVKVENFIFEINIFNGLNDFTWLALAATKLYSEKKYPIGNYLPTILRIGDYSPHPRTKLCDFFKESENWDELIIDVDIYKPNGIRPQEYEDWWEKAFGSQRNLMKYKFSWYADKRPEIVEKEKKLGIKYYLAMKYRIYPEVAYEFSSKDYKNTFNKELIEKELDKGIYELYTEITVPYGEIEADFIYYTIPSKENDEEAQATGLFLLINEKSRISEERIPNPIPQAEIWRRMKENQQLKLDDPIKEVETLTLEQSLAELCPYNAETLCHILMYNEEFEASNRMSNYAEQLISDLKTTVSKNIIKLYEIFYEYSSLYDQRDKRKDEISICLEDVMHFLKYYQIIHDSLTLFQFIDYYDCGNKRIRDYNACLDEKEFGVRFPEFVLIILKCSEFLNSMNSLSDESGINKFLIESITKAYKIHENESEMSSFMKYIRYSTNVSNAIINFKPKIKLIFISQLKYSIQVSEQKYHLLPEELKSIIKELGYKGENSEEIVILMFKELGFDLFQGYEGVFYFEFLQILLWMGMTFIKIPQDKENKTIDDEILVKKFHCLIESLSTLTNDEAYSEKDEDLNSESKMDSP